MQGPRSTLTVALLAAATAAQGLQLEVVHPSGPEPAATLNPPLVEAIVDGALLDDAAWLVTIDGIRGCLLPEDDGTDNDSDGLVDELGERLVSFPGPARSRFVARWPWAIAADDPSTSDNEGIHTLVISVRAGMEALTREVSIAVFRTGGIDSLLVCPSPFDPFHEAVRIGYRSTTAGTMRIRVHDFQGRVVATVHGWRSVDPGWFFPWATWDGRDGDGHRVANGVYFVRVEFDDGLHTEERVERCLV
ncbi:MAG: hypothetical protein MUE60_09265, partial [Candidatus Eisenbacteria bacterium]|nr:hypothetical protein [Candidatus Eisenbacteria bacterium]